MVAYDTWKIYTVKQTPFSMFDIHIYCETVNYYILSYRLLQTYKYHVVLIVLILHAKKKSISVS